MAEPALFGMGSTLKLVEKQIDRKWMVLYTQTQTLEHDDDDDDEVSWLVVVVVVFVIVVVVLLWWPLVHITCQYKVRGVERNYYLLPVQINHWDTRLTSFAHWPNRVQDVRNSYLDNYWRGERKRSSWQIKLTKSLRSHCCTTKKNDSRTKG